MPQPVATRTQRNGLALSGRHEPFPTLFSLQVFEVADMVHNQLSRCPAQFAFFRFEPVRQIGAAHVCDRVRFDVAASVERRCPAFETRLVKGSGLDCPFLLVLYGEQFVVAVLLVDFSYRAPVFARKCFIHTVLHDISEVVQHDAVVGDQVIVAKSHCFPIVSVEDFEVVVEYQS